MTLDEAIEERLKVIKVQEKLYEESYSDESKEIIKSAIDNDRQLAEWLMEAKDLREENIYLISEFDRLIKENGEQIAEYKRLLKAAVEDIHDVLSSQIKITNYTLCEKCKHYLNCNCKDKCMARYNLKQWRFADEALKLIGDESSGV